MTDQPTNFNPSQSLAGLVRAGADGELNAADQARLDAMIAADPELTKRLEFEKQLRTGCGRAMGSVSCPDSLRASIGSMVSGSHGEAAHTAGSGESGVESMAAQTRDQSFWAGKKPRVLVGLAAMLLMSLSAVLVWQSVMITQQPSLPTGGALITASYRQELAEFVTKEHTRTGENEKVAESKFVYTDPEAARQWFVGLLGDEIKVPALSQPIESIEFKGVGKCGVPGSAYGKSAHMRYVVTAADGHLVVVSVFVSPRSEQVIMTDGTTYAVDMSACGIEGYSVLAWTDGIANYFLVADQGTEGCSATIKAIGQPEPTESL